MTISHLLPHFTPSKAWRDGQIPVIARGEGVWLYDTEGRDYLDGLSGLFCVNIGHGRGDLADAAAEQIRKVGFSTTWGWAHEPGIEAARLIGSLAPGDLNRVFFVNSGSEAVESAVKLARTYHLARGEVSRHKIIARDWCYHGTTLGALSVTGVPKFREPFAPYLNDSVVRVANTLGSAPAPGGGPGSLAAADAVEEAILREGPETVSVVIAEPVQNGNGALVPPDGYWQRLREICDRYGVLLCADEVITGFGRVGHWFASERFGVVPDLITFAKGVTSAYQPLGGVIARDTVADAVAEGGMFTHGATFGSHPVATAVAIANLRAMEAEGVVKNVLALQDALLTRLQTLAERHQVVKEVRGTGFLYALELTADRPSGTPLSDAQQAGLLGGGVLNAAIRESGLVIRPDDRGATCLVVAPPLISDEPVFDELVTRLDKVLARTADWLSANG